MLWSLVKVRKYQCFFQSCFREAKGKVNWPATRMSGETCVHSARAYSKAMHTIPTFFVPNHEKPQPFYFEGNMQSQIVPIQCMVLHVTKLACTYTHVRASRVCQLTSTHWRCTFIRNPRISEETSTFSKAVVAPPWPNRFHFRKKHHPFESFFIMPFLGIVKSSYTSLCIWTGQDVMWLLTI